MAGALVRCISAMKSIALASLHCWLSNKITSRKCLTTACAGKKSGQNFPKLKHNIGEKDKSSKPKMALQEKLQ